MQLRDSLHRVLGDSYRLGQEITGGGMSRVFLAQDLGLARPVVIKVLSMELDRGVGIERFKRETAILARLQHPHVVPILSAGEADGLPFIVMPFVQGESLRERLTRQGRLSVQETLGIVDDVAKALAFAHSQGVIHRDIKPENILLSGGAAVVTDFGISKALESSQVRGAGESATGPHPRTVTTAGFSIGTPAYMAPEQAAADPSIDGRADLYALGIVTFEMLTGERPFTARTPRELLAAQLSETPPLVNDMRSDVPPALATVVAELLAKDPANRPESAATLLARLNAVMTPTPDAFAVSAERRRLFEAIRAPGWSRWWVGAVVAVLLLTIASATMVLRQRGSSGRVLDPGLVAVVPFRVGGADPSLRYLREGMVDLLATKLTGVGGARTTEPRSLLIAWRRAGGSPEADLPDADVRRVARGLGSGRVLLGSIVGTPAQVVLAASLVRTASGATLAEATVSGPADSLLYLVDRLTAQLLTLGAGEEEQRLATLTSTSLPALRSYLEGRSAARQARFRDAYASLSRALTLDSTFALAAIELQSVAGWIGSDSVTRRAAAIAWAGRSRVSARDRALIDVLLGPRYPAPSPATDMLIAANRYLALAPDAPEAWFHVGDLFYHNGGILRVSDTDERAHTDFLHAIAIDSSYVEPMLHLYQLAVQAGDHLLARRIDRLWTTVDSSASRLVASRWYAATAFGDSVTVQALRAQMARDEVDVTALRDIEQIAREVGLGTSDARRALASELRQRLRLSSAELPASLRLPMAYDMGHSIEASHVAHLIGGKASEWPLALDVLSWPYAEGDSALSAQALPLLDRSVRGPMPADAQGRRDRAFSIIALAAAHYVRGERAALIADREGAVIDGRLPSSEGVARALLDAMVVMLDSVPVTARVMVQLDSTLRGESPESGEAGLYAIANLMLARYLASHGDPVDALAHARSRGGWDSTLWLAPMLHLEGDLAARTGDRAGAVRAYQHYLALRYDPDPVARSSRDSVVQALRALTQPSTRSP